MNAPPREPYTIDDKGREIKIEVLRNGYGRWYCFRCRQSGTTHHEPTPEDCERMAELHGRAHKCIQDSPPGPSDGS